MSYVFTIYSSVIEALLRLNTFKFTLKEQHKYLQFDNIKQEFRDKTTQ